eukprot:CAMPEP_0205820450 /NCGR_PEP_ID=MMETSP0206-20130828/3088_1 /ASSEMBLY_ACC=CAM_ASM_000279 /TAXON_ID=36767 /ORGANISM="Euplotes focardii, Strain TN1" /LENGTH=381 /DNA_ID=CAMNT_0053115163 /DNA_START=32 /DNA_END=1177 /DNA_ORIENTATION=-
MVAAFYFAGVLSAWEPERANLATIALGIACPVQNVCYIGTSQDGVGNVVLVTRNGGQSYERATLVDGQPPSVMMLMSTAASSATHAATAGMGFGTNVRAATDGESFAPLGMIGLLGVTQNLRTIPGTRGYAQTGSFASLEGEGEVAVSLDGESWQLHDVPDEALGGPARYGAFVDANTWYISGGTWPRATGFGLNETVHAFSETIAINKKTGQFKYAPVENRAARNGYIAAVARTRDGGATFQNVYLAQNQGYYFNQIECPTVSVCYVVGEGPAGARIMGTQDAGATWRILWEPTTRTNLMGLTFLSQNEGWACGSQAPAPFEIDTLFLHTTNGGRSWTPHLAGGMSMCTDMSFHGGQPNFAHATAIGGLSGTSGTYVYRA